MGELFTRLHAPAIEQRGLKVYSSVKFLQNCYNVLGPQILERHEIMAPPNRRSTNFGPQNNYTAAHKVRDREQFNRKYRFQVNESSDFPRKNIRVFTVISAT